MVEKNVYGTNLNSKQLTMPVFFYSLSLSASNRPAFFLLSEAWFNLTGLVPVPGRTHHPYTPGPIQRACFFRDAFFNVFYFIKLKLDVIDKKDEILFSYDVEI